MNTETARTRASAAPLARPRHARRRSMLLAARIVLAALCASGSIAARADERGSTEQQVAAQSPADEKFSRESVLVSFTLSAPAGVENDIAREHNLELVSKLPLPTLGLRIVRYSIPDSRPAAAVIARLRNDARVSSAQLNFEYRQIEPDSQDTVVGSLQKLPGPRKDTSRKTIVQRQEAELFGDKRRTRSARIAAGDVLAGGL